MNDKEKCLDCLFYEQSAFESECAKCVNHSQFTLIADFMEDMELWETSPPYGKPEEYKLKYLPIRWLIDILLKYQNEDSVTWFNGIVSKPKGTRQDNDLLPCWLCFYFRDIWVDQYRNGGYTGDDYAGNVYYKLFPFVYLKFEYQC